MAKKISQETFDDVVKENIEEFDMDAAEALQDAIKQFLKQGVTLTNIDTSGGVGRQEILDAISELDKVARSGGSTEGILNAIKSVSTMSSKDYPLFERNLMLINEKGGLNSLHLLFDVKQPTSVLLATMSLLNDLSKLNVEIRDFFEPGGCKRLCDVIAFSSPDSESLRIKAIQLGRTVAKTENNKNQLMMQGIGAQLVSIVNDFVASSADGIATGTTATLLQETCSLVRGLCIHDDYRKEMSSAYENGRYFIKQSNFMQSLVSLAKKFRSQPAVAAAALWAARNMINTEEAVQIISQCGAIELIADILTWEESSLSLAKSAVGLMRNVCADDVRKDRLVADGTLDLLILAMTKEVYASDYPFMEHALACLACMSLRSPSNSQRIVQTGNSVELIVKTMRRYSDKGALQRQACLTLRNIAARCPDLRGLLLDAGVEGVLRSAGRIQGVVDEAYGALRDLEVDVNFVKISGDGTTVEPVYEQFGAAPKLQFNPVYDDNTAYLEQRVREEARPPVQLDSLRVDLEEDEDDDHHQHKHEHQHGGHSGDCCGGGESGNHSHDHDHNHGL